MIRGIVGTGGHIDHGKTALVEALTGIRTDRLPEEQRRGITIDLGFAHLELDDGIAGVVDVPGHEDFIRNMVAGASGFDLFLLVVAADEGVMPQTREHVAIAELLGVPAAVVALTKIDLVDPEWLELAADDVATFLADTRFADAPVVPTSAVTGAGLDGLRKAISTAMPATRGRPDDIFRLPVDRVFTVHGTGTVATGTVWSGRLGHDQHVRILPGKDTARVRALQVHGKDVPAVQAGQRAAIALAGIDRDDVGRGATLVAEPGWEATRLLTTSLRVLPGSEWTIEHGQRLRVHLGTAEIMARAFLANARQPLGPGDEAWAQLRFEAPVVARAGDRIVVRSYSPVTTIGGGIVAEPVSRRRRRITAEDEELLATLVGEDRAERVAAAVRRAGLAGAPRRELPLRTGVMPAEVDEALAAMDAVIAGDAAFPTDAARQVASVLSAAVADYHQREPLRQGMDPQALRRAAPAGTADALLSHTLDSLLGDGSLAMRGGRVALAGFSPSLTSAQQALSDRLLATLDQAGCAPPRLDELRETSSAGDELLALLALLEADGRIVRLDHDLFIHHDHIQRVIQDVRSTFAGRTDLGPAEFRDVIPTSRKHLIPILEHLDRLGVTTRAGVGRAVPHATG
jgi:selenocysteine-specific elongation factor